MSIEEVKNFLSLKAIKEILFSPKVPIVLDIGMSNIKFVELEGPPKTDGTIEIKKYKIVEVPQQTLLATYTDNPIVNSVVLKDLIENIIKSYNLKNRNAYILLFDNVLVTNWLNLTVKDGEVINNLILEKLSTFLPVAVSEWFIDFMVVEEKKENKTVITEAILKKNLFEFGEIIQNLGLNPLLIDGSSINIINIFHPYLSSLENSKKNIAIVNIGHTNSTVMIFKDGILKNIRTLSIGGQNFTQNIMENKGLEFEEAEKYKKEELFFFTNPEEQNNNENYLMIKPSFGRLIKDMYDSFDHYLAKFREFKIHEIILCGGGANFKNMSYLINKHLNIPTRTCGDILKIKYAGNELLVEEKNILATVIGALLR